MRKIGWIFLSLCLLTVTACKKYDDGPSISFRSHTARVSNTWKVEKLLINGSDMTAQAPPNFLQTFSEDGVYSFSYTNGSKTETGQGKWEFQNDDMEIKVSGISNASSKTLFILKLKESSFWYYYMDGSDKYEYHLVEN